MQHTGIWWIVALAAFPFIFMMALAAYEWMFPRSPEEIAAEANYLYRAANCSKCKSRWISTVGGGMHQQFRKCSAHKPAPKWHPPRHVGEWQSRGDVDPGPTATNRQFERDLKRTLAAPLRTHPCK